MIGRLSGLVVSSRGERVVVDVGGVGYEIAMNPKAIAALPGPDEETVVYTHLHLREDGMQLFGFGAETDRDLFRVLLGASGVGPKVAMAILSVFSADALRAAVAAEDAEALTRVPGVGTRSAQKIILDLKPKFADLEADVLEGRGVPAQLRQALEALGYGPSEIRSAVAAIDTSLPLPEQIRSALRELGR